jgi:hypothetical protein
VIVGAIGGIPVLGFVGFLIGPIILATFLSIVGYDYF